MLKVMERGRIVGVLFKGFLLLVFGDWVVFIKKCYLGFLFFFLFIKFFLSWDGLLYLW